MELFSRSGRKCWSAGAGNQGPLPANRGFRAQAGCQRGRSRIQGGYGQSEATLKPPSGHLVANPPFLLSQTYPDHFPAAFPRRNDSGVGQTSGRRVHGASGSVDLEALNSIFGRLCPRSHATGRAGVRQPEINALPVLQKSYMLNGLPEFTGRGQGHESGAWRERTTDYK
jgi:hypothetical protein